MEKFSRSLKFHFILTLRMMVIFMLKVKRPFDAYLDEMNKITILLHMRMEQVGHFVCKKEVM